MGFGGSPQCFEQNAELADATESMPADGLIRPSGMRHRGGRGARGARGASGPLIAVGFRQSVCGITREIRLQKRSCFRQNELQGALKMQIHREFPAFEI